MAKKINGPIKFNLREDQFCEIWEANSRDCKFGIQAHAEFSYCTMLYQNGAFVGMMEPGEFYPFSVDCRKKGSRFGSGTIQSAKIAAISSAYKAEMRWGTQNGLWVDYVDENQEHNRLRFGAHGTFYVKLMAGTDGLHQSWFYREFLSQGDPNMTNLDVICKKLKAAFQPWIINEVQKTLEELINEKGYRPEKLFGLTPTELLEVSQRSYKKLESILAAQGITLVPELSEGAIVEGIIDPRTSEKLREQLTQNPLFRP